MKRLFFIPIGFFAATAILLYFFKNQLPEPLYNLYATNMRMPFFTGFLTIGGFLLSLKTFILIKLKEDLFQSDLYLERVIEARDLNGDQNLSAIDPLKKLGDFLFYCVLFSLLTAISQITIGFIDSDKTAIFCMSAVASTLSVVFIAWYYIHANLQIWFELFEKDANDRIEKIRKTKNI